MKKTFFFLLLLLAAIHSVHAQNRSIKMFVALKAGKISVNKKDITKDWKISSIVKLLDSGTRNIPGNYIKHVYDDLGIVLFERTEEKKATGEPAELQFFMDATEESSYTPKEFYEGKIKVEDLNISVNSTIEAVRAALKGYAEKEMDEDDVYRFSRDGMYILLRYNEQKKLQKISFGKEMPRIQ